MRRPTMTGELRRLRQVLAGGLSFRAAGRELGRSEEWVRTWNARLGGRPRIAMTHHAPAVPAWLLAHRAAVARAQLAGLLARLQEGHS